MQEVEVAAVRTAPKFSYGTWVKLKMERVIQIIFVTVLVTVNNSQEIL